MSHSIKWSNNEPIITFNGLVNIKEINQLNCYFVGLPNFESTLYQIWDFSKIDLLDISDLDLEIIASLDTTAGTWNKRLKIALVNKNNINQHKFKKYKQLMHNTKWSVEIFENFKDAKNWCNKEAVSPVIKSNKQIP